MTVRLRADVLMTLLCLSLGAVVAGLLPLGVELWNGWLCGNLRGTRLSFGVMGPVFWSGLALSSLFGALVYLGATGRIRVTGSFDQFLAADRDSSSNGDDLTLRQDLILYGGLMLFVVLSTFGFRRLPGGRFLSAPAGDDYGLLGVSLGYYRIFGLEFTGAAAIYVVLVAVATYYFYKYRRRWRRR